MLILVKKVGLIAASAFLVWQSLNLVKSFSTLDTTSPIPLFFIAFITNLFITGIFAFAGFALPTQKLMPSAYYQIHKPGKLRKYFRLMKVELFRNFLLLSFWRNKEQQKRYFDGTRDGLKNLETQSMKSEFGHLIPAILIALITIYLLILGHYLLVFFTTILNILGNIYPIILQRHHRMRIAILQRRMKTKQN